MAMQAPETKTPKNQSTNLHTFGVGSAECAERLNKQSDSTNNRSSYFNEALVVVMGAPVVIIISIIKTMITRISNITALVRKGRRHPHAAPS